VRGRRDGELGERVCARRTRRYAVMNRRRGECLWARRSGTDGRPGSSLAAVLGKTSLPHWPRILAVLGNSGVREDEAQETDRGSIRRDSKTFG
jgi:hypothetical protein